MTENTDRAVLIDFIALSGTGKSTHSRALCDYLNAHGFKTKILSFTTRRDGKNGSFGKPQRPPLSVFFKSIGIGRKLWRLSSSSTSVSKLAFLIKWSYRVLAYDNQLRRYGSKGLDYVIMDPSLSSKLKNFYRHFDEGAIVNVIALLEQNSLMSDIIVFIEADMEIVKKRRQARGSEEIAKGDQATIPVKKAFIEIDQRNTSMNLVTVNYDCFSRLESNLEHITEVCKRVRSELHVKNTG